MGVSEERTGATRQTARITPAINGGAAPEGAAPLLSR